MIGILCVLAAPWSLARSPPECGGCRWSRCCPDHLITGRGGGRREGEEREGRGREGRGRDEREGGEGERGEREGGERERWEGERGEGGRWEGERWWERGGVGKHVYADVSTIWRTW